MLAGSGLFAARYALGFLREIRVQVEQTGFRSRTIIVVTTLLDAEAYSKTDLAELYRSPWNNELDLRPLKRTMQMEILRCKAPEPVPKEVWTHILAYNLIRTIMAQAADKHDLEPLDQLQSRHSDVRSLLTGDRTPGS